MEKNLDIIIIGGSFAGLSAALTLGRSLRNVLVIDGGEPCNKRVLHAHNIVTHDGDSPAAILEQARKRLEHYENVSIRSGLVVHVRKNENVFEVSTTTNKRFTAKKILLATGLHDDMSAIEGFEECWTVSIFHCPYCHGYEVRNQKLGLFGNGELGFEFVRMLSNWSKDLVLFTNGESTLKTEQRLLLEKKGIPVYSSPIEYLQHDNGIIKEVRLIDGKSIKVEAIFAKPALRQNSNLHELIGCAVNEHNLLVIDEMQRTTVPGVYAAGDNTSMFRALTMAMASGTKAGAVLNKELIDEEF